MKWLVIFVCLVLTTEAIKKLVSAERRAVRDRHNQIRRSVARGQQTSAKGKLPQAMNMREMVYDTAMEDLATTWASKCVWKHSSDYENLYASSGLTTNYTAALLAATNAWFAEIRGFNGSVDNFVFNTAYGHFTAQIWHSTSKIGCAVNRCANLKGFRKNATFVVCSYSPSGNKGGSQIYASGKTCSMCPYGTKCSNYMCVKDATVKPKNTTSLTATERYQLLRRINAKRASLAKGLEKDSKKKALPKAANLFKMAYDTNLQALAMKDVSTCSSTTEISGKAANTILLTSTSTLSENPDDFVYAIDFMWNPGSYNGSVSKYNGVARSFANLAWATNQKVGCARKVCYNSSLKQRLTKIVCVFNQKNPEKGKPIYTAGTTCSKCPSGYTCSSSLCVKKTT